MRPMFLSMMVLVGCASSQRSGSRSTPATPTSELAAFIDELLPAHDDEEGDGPIALVATGDPFLAAVTDTWHEEGTGSGLTLVVFHGQDADEPIEVSSPAQDPEDTSGHKRAREALLKRFRGREVERVSGLAWPESVDAEGETVRPAEFALLDLGVTIRRADDKLRFVGTGGKERATLDLADEIDEGFVAVPTTVFARSGDPTILVSVLFDPGEGYTEGMNVYTQTYLVRLGK